MSGPPSTLFVWALFGLTTLGAMLPLEVGRRREDHVVLTISATFVLAVLGPRGLLLIWGSAVLGLVLRRVAAALGGRSAADRATRSDPDGGWWLLGTAGAITVGFSLAHPTYTVLFDRTYPFDASTGGDLAVAALVLNVAWIGTMSGRLVLHQLGARLDSRSASGDNFDPFDSPWVAYLLPIVAGTPTLAAALALYRPEEPWSAWAILLWCLPIYGACRFDLHRRHVAQQLRRDAAARQRLAAIGEVTARIVHQSRHQAGLMGWSIHRLRRLLADPGSANASEVATDVGRELDILATAKQHIQDTFDRELLHETTTSPAAPDEPSAASLAGTIGDVCAQLEAKARHRGVAIDVRVEEETGRNPSPAALREALYNLVDNALDAAVSVVHVVACREPGGSDGPNDILVEVSDDGTGIPGAVATDLYEPFVSTKPDGTGMGLAIADALVAELGGHLRHERQHDTTRFVLTLPVGVER